MRFPRRSDLSVLRPAPVRKRLWQAAAAMVLLLGTVVAGNFFISPERSVSQRMLGHDFLAFYTAGSFARTGQFQLLYDLPTVAEAQRGIAQTNALDIKDETVGPFWNPPFYAWLLAPLSAMPYHAALSVWTGLNLACLVVAVVMLVRMLPPMVARPPSNYLRLADDPLPVKFARDWRNWALVPLLLFASMPFIQALTHGQNTFMSLMLLTLTVTAWRARMAVTAGVCCGLLLYKPQLAVVVGAMLVLSLGMRVCLGIGCVGGVMLLLTGLTMPHALGDYLARLPLNLAFMQIDSPYHWERHVTLKAFYRLLFNGNEAGLDGGVARLLTTWSVALLTVGLLGAWLRTRRPGVDDCWTGETRAAARDRLIVATVTSMPLLMPFYFDYDLLLLSVPATLFAGEVMARPVGARLDPMQRWQLAAWVALYGCLMVNPGLARWSGINVTVLLLGIVAGLSIARACRHGIRAAAIVRPEIEQVAVKRAA